MFRLERWTSSENDEEIHYFLEQDYVLGYNPKYFSQEQIETFLGQAGCKVKTQSVQYQNAKDINMSAWRNFLSAVLPWLFKTGEAAAEAAVNKQDVGKAAGDAAKGAVDDPKVVQAATDVVNETVRKVGK